MIMTNSAIRRIETEDVAAIMQAIGVRARASARRIALAPGVIAAELRPLVLAAGSASSKLDR